MGSGCCLQKIRSIEIKFDQSTFDRANVNSIDRIFPRSIDFTGHSESAATAETEPEKPNSFFFLDKK
jgi:hypothetical protein